MRAPSLECIIDFEYIGYARLASFQIQTGGWVIRIYRRIFVYTFCSINICLSLSDDANKIKTLNIERHNSLSFLWKFESNSSNGFGEILF